MSDATRFCVNWSAVERADHATMPSVARSSSSTASMRSMFSGVNKSTTSVPSSIVKRVTIAWPPKRSW